MIRLLTALNNRINPEPSGKYCLVCLLSIFIFHECIATPLVCLWQSGAADASMNRADSENRLSNGNGGFTSQYFSGFSFSSNIVTIYLKDGRMISGVKLKSTKDGRIALKYRKASVVDSVKFVQLGDIEKVVDAKGMIKYPIPPEDQESYYKKSKKLAKTSLVFGLISLILFPVWVVSLPCAFIAYFKGKKARKRYLFQQDKKGEENARFGVGVSRIIISVLILLLIAAAIILPNS